MSTTKIKSARPNRIVHGRPEEISQDLIDKMCNAVRAGAYIESAAVLCGISKVTLYGWLKRGHKEPGTIYERFLNDMNKSMEECMMRDVLNIDRCAMGQDYEYERYPKNSKDSNGNDIEGQLVLNSRGNPIPKKIGAAADWKASAWRLERRFPKRWGPIQTIVTENEIAEKEVAELSEDQLQERLQQNLKKLELLK